MISPWALPFPVSETAARPKFGISDLWKSLFPAGSFTNFPPEFRHLIRPGLIVTLNIPSLPRPWNRKTPAILGHLGGWNFLRKILSYFQKMGLTFRNELPYIGICKQSAILSFLKICISGSILVRTVNWGRNAIPYDESIISSRRFLHPKTTTRDNGRGV